MGRRKKLNTKEELDFAYLLELMMPLKDTPEYALLPELFSIIGHENLLRLCKYAGGEIIKIPTMSELSDAMYALQFFYDVDIKHSKSELEIPQNLIPLYSKIVEVYNAGNSEE